MRITPSLLLLIAGAAVAQDDFSDFDDEDWGDEPKGLPWSGFVEGAYGSRVHDDPNFTSNETLGDLRMRLETDWSGKAIGVTFKGEVLYDDVANEWSGELRDFSMQTSPGDSTDLKIGRQVLTWGTGDLLFLNDLFPKSWISFFAGRDDEYLKAPSDAFRVTAYTQPINIDFVWTPVFEPDEYLTGERFSFFSPGAGGIVAPSPPLSADTPDRRFDNGEFSLRLFRTAGSTEYAIYVNRGFFKRPVGLDQNQRPYFPALSTLGGSLRRPLGPGLVNAEFAYYDSRDDSDGSDPGVPNDQLRLLGGYEFEAAPRFNVGFQYYLEWTLDYGRLIASSPAPQYEPAERRHVLTNRLTYRLARDKVTLSLFTFYSPTDDDYYVRPTIDYRRNDRWTLSGGFNIFGGEQIHTFFGQLADDTNAYLRARFNF